MNETIILSAQVQRIAREFDNRLQAQYFGNIQDRQFTRKLMTLDIRASAQNRYSRFISVAVEMPNDL
jgi:hypothetical protein